MFYHYVNPIVIKITQEHSRMISITYVKRKKKLYIRNMTIYFVTKYKISTFVRLKYWKI